MRTKDLPRLLGVEKKWRSAKTKLITGDKKKQQHYRTVRNKAASLMARRGYKPEATVEAWNRSGRVKKLQDKGPHGKALARHYSGGSRSGPSYARNITKNALSLARDTKRFRTVKKEAFRGTTFQYFLKSAILGRKGKRRAVHRQYRKEDIEERARFAKTHKGKRRRRPFRRRRFAHLRTEASLSNLKKAWRIGKEAEHRVLKRGAPSVWDKSSRYIPGAEHDARKARKAFRSVIKRTKNPLNPGGKPARKPERNLRITRLPTKTVPSNRIKLRSGFKFRSEAMIFHVVENYNETLGKAPRSSRGERLRGMYKGQDRAHRSKQYSRREKVYGKMMKRADKNWPMGKNNIGTQSSGRAAAFKAHGDLRGLRKAAAKGRATTPKGANYSNSYNYTKARTALRKAKGDKATRGKIHKSLAKQVIQHSRNMRKTKLPG